MMLNQNQDAAMAYNAWNNDAAATVGLTRTARDGLMGYSSDELALARLRFVFQRWIGGDRVVSFVLSCSRSAQLVGREAMYLHSVVVC